MDKSLIKNHCPKSIIQQIDKVGSDITIRRQIPSVIENHTSSINLFKLGHTRNYY